MFKFILPLLLLMPIVHAADVKDMAARINRLEYRTSTMEKKLFKGTDINQDGSSAFADFELRLQELEKENTTLYGSVEQLGRAVEQLAKQVKDMNDDIVLRLQDLEQQVANGGGAPSPAKKPDVNPVVAAAPAPAAIEKPAHLIIPDDMSPQKIYRTAYKALTTADYQKSKVWFEELIKRHPEDKLAENAHYWLGETNAVEGDHTAAIVAYKNGLSAFPKGTKAPSYLFKMGESFIEIDKAHHAKSVWKKLMTDYPKSQEAQKAEQRLASLEAAQTPETPSTPEDEEKPESAAN